VCVLGLCPRCVYKVCTRGLTGDRSRCSEPLWTPGILGRCRGNNSESAHKQTNKQTNKQPGHSWNLKACLSGGAFTDSPQGGPSQSLRCRWPGSRTRWAVGAAGRWGDNTPCHLVLRSSTACEYETHWFLSRSSRRSRPPTSRPHCSRSGWPSWGQTAERSDRDVLSVTMVTLPRSPNRSGALVQDLRQPFSILSLSSTPGKGAGLNISNQLSIQFSLFV